MSETTTPPPVLGRLYDIGPTGEPVPARVVTLPDGALCWLWSAHGDPAAAPIDRFPHDRPMTTGHRWES